MLLRTQTKNGLIVINLNKMLYVEKVTETHPAYDEERHELMIVFENEKLYLSYESDEERDTVFNSIYHIAYGDVI